MNVRALLLALAFAGLTAGLTACGGDSPEDVVKDFGEALIDGDTEEACDLLSGDVREQLATGDAECKEAIKQLVPEGDEKEKAEKELDDAEFESEEDGDEATVTVKGEDDEEDEVKLVKEDGDWKIADLG